jgi:hypothetical protein
MTTACDHPGALLRVICALSTAGSPTEPPRLETVLCECSRCNAPVRIKRDGTCEDSIQVAAFRVDLFKLPARIAAAAAAGGPLQSDPIPVPAR